MMIVNIILTILAAYVACGFLFTVPFVIKGIDRIDENASGGSIGFRIIIIPGCIVFWPLLLRKWLNAGKHNKPAKE